MSEFEESDRIRIPELAFESRLSSEAYLYQSPFRPVPNPVLPAGFPSFSSEADGSLIFTSDPGFRDREPSDTSRPLSDDGSDSLISTGNSYANVRMTDSGDLASLTVRIDGGVEVDFDIRDLLSRDGRFQDGVHGHRIFNENGTVTYTSLNGAFRLVVDRCGKVLSMDLRGKSGYRPSARRLAESSCIS